MKVFLSYSPDDAGSVIAPLIGKMLADRGFDVWDPDIEILPGDNWAKAIGEALEQSDAMVVVLTDHYIGSSWSWQDISYAIANERYRDRVIPVVVEGRGDQADQAWTFRLPRIRWDRRNPEKVVEAIENSLKAAA